MGTDFTYYQDTIKAQNQSVEISKNITTAQVHRFNSHVDTSDYIPSRQHTEVISELMVKPSIILPNRERQYPGTDWLTVLIFAGIALFASIRYGYAKYIHHLFLSLFNYATSVRMLNDKSYPVFHAAYRLEIIFYLALSIFVYQGLNLIKWESARVNPTYFGFVLGGVLVYFFGKKLIYLTLGLLFETQNETREYLFNMDNFNRSLSLILLPIVILVAFAPFKTPVFITVSGLIIFLIFNLLLLKRGVFILLKKQFSLFYLFLYLCTLEILPLLLIYKVVV
ncbi:DUF4271 domain-containing protein [Draconibacterium sp. IB214405]|uniref:DUF4271 domain-containing protein n=1 Tax=Draconibacterium sp. IB214405 TaxID=3097352 RepID=UPI002A1313EF|nr:DUF4271 domain-containing protein [Draconibacterium sp. IB214405]MDX8341623.1 DUF4271 domain-containing protein [Draconibacterium sp. IB214405]